MKDYFYYYLILSSEFNAFLKQIKVILSTVKKYRVFPLVTNTTGANRGCFDSCLAEFHSEKILNAGFLCAIMLQAYTNQTKH